MSDSDCDLITNNVFPFGDESTTVSVRGPHINMNLHGFGFGNNIPSSTMHMSRHNEWRRQAKSTYDQKSMGYRRETSPISTTSACDVRQRNFNSFYERGVSSQRSMYNGRGGSPMSVRSLASNVSDVDMAIKNMELYGPKVIRQAYQKFMKKKQRKRMEKSRNLRRFIKVHRRKSGYDSGELGSNSSISSDDNSSMRTSSHRNMSSCRSTYTDTSNFQTKIKKRNMFMDSMDNLNQNRGWNIVRNSGSTSRSVYESFQSTMTLEDRFKNGFQLPSQRFNRTVAVSIPEVSENPSERVKQIQTKAKQKPSNQLDRSSDDEEILSEITAIERTTNQREKEQTRKRSSDDNGLPTSKRLKSASPCKNMLKNSTAIENGDFEFAKPAFPVRKVAKGNTSMSANKNNLVAPEKLIAKSAAPLSDRIIPTTQPINVEQTTSQLNTVEEIATEDRSDPLTVSQSTDISMRPSFIKRKLFTQKMDVADNKNNNDILAANSPQNSIYGAIQKEKHKARKLVTSQYCLSRDIQTDNNNLLDLIHKIVPAERMNATNQTNRTVVQNNIKSLDEDDKWDVTSIISVRNNDENVSDTFTDEEAVDANNEKTESSKIIKESAPKVQVSQKVLFEKNATSIKSISKNIRSFWDTDYDDTDDEAMMQSRKEDSKENKRTGIFESTFAPKVPFKGFSSMFPSNKASTLGHNVSVINNTVASALKFNNTSRSFKIFSHRTSKHNPKKGAEKDEEAKAQIEPQNKNHPTLTANEKCEASTLEKENDHKKAKTQKEQKNVKQLQERKNSPQKKRRTTKKNDVTSKVSKPDEQPKNKINKQIKTHENGLQIKSQTNKETDTVANKHQGKKESGNNNCNEHQREVVVQTKKQIITVVKSVKQQNKNSEPTIKKQNNKKTDSVQLSTANKNNSRGRKANASKLSDSLIYEDSLSETINKSIRPVRACRISKQNETTSTSSNSMNMTLRSRSREGNATITNTKPKPTARNTKKTTTKHDQSNLSELSFSIASDKTTVNKKLKIHKTKEIDTSEVSFSLSVDKDTLPKRGKSSSKLIKQAVVKITPISNNMINSLKNDTRPLRNRIRNRRYVA